MILIPERQHPILVDRIVYWQDPFFEAIMASQTGPLPWPPSRRDDMDAMEAVVESRLREGRVAYPAAEAAPCGQECKAEGATAGARDRGRQAPKKAESRQADGRRRRLTGGGARHRGGRRSGGRGLTGRTCGCCRGCSTDKIHALVRDVAQDVHGGSDRRSDADILAAIKPDAGAGRARMAGFTKGVKAKGKAA